MLTQVDVTNIQGDLLTLPLGDVSQGIVVRSIDGLDPVKASIVRSGFAQQDGTTFHAARREDRNITMVLSLEPIYGGGTVYEIRKYVYSFFRPKTPVTLKFYLDSGLELVISGRVESCESPMFTKEPMVSVSMLMFDPDFQDRITRGGGFDVSPPMSQGTINYDGTVESGFVGTGIIGSGGTLGGFTLTVDSPGHPNQTFAATSSLLVGDVITISTVPGDLYITRKRGTDTVSLLSSVTSYSVWPKLYPGENLFTMRASAGSWIFTISYRNRYGEV